MQFHIVLPRSSLFKLKCSLTGGVTPGGGVVVIRISVRLNSDSDSVHQWSLNYSSCDVRIELAVRSLSQWSPKY